MNGKRAKVAYLFVETRLSRKSFCNGKNLSAIGRKHRRDKTAARFGLKRRKENAVFGHRSRGTMRSLISQGENSTPCCFKNALARPLRKDFRERGVLVPPIGVEPIRLAAQDPKSCASANFATAAYAPPLAGRRGIVVFLSEEAHRRPRVRVIPRCSCPCHCGRPQTALRRDRDRPARCAP